MKSSFSVRSSLLLLILAFCGLPGCGDAVDEDLGSSPSAIGGVRVSDEQLCHFRYGLTAPGDVQSLLGPAQGSLANAPGELLLIYSFSAGPTVFEQVTFAFEADLLKAIQRSHAGTPARAIPACVGSPL